MKIEEFTDYYVESEKEKNSITGKLINVNNFSTYIFRYSKNYFNETLQIIGNDFNNDLIEFLKNYGKNNI